MGERAEERVYRGIAASGGVAFGTVVLDMDMDMDMDMDLGGDVDVGGDGDGAGTRQAGPPEDEVRALQDAITRAGEELDALIRGEDRLAAEILELQRALLDDESLIDPILGAVKDGAAADTAWTAALDREIAEYRAGDDVDFSARADDLVDLKARVLAALRPAEARTGTAVRDGLHVGEELTPSRFLTLDWSRLRGAALRGGSPAGHVAILARARGIPLVVGVRDLDHGIADGTTAVLDAEGGRLIVSPRPETLAEVKRRAAAFAERERDAARLLDRPAVTAGGEPVTVLVNADVPESLQAVSPRHCDGIGLVRTELLFQGGALPDEASQLATYRRLLAWAAGKPVTIRTLDAGGDKPIPGLTVGEESNSFLGVRGVRLSLARPEVFRAQLRALARAAAGGPLKLMVPMVTTPEEIERVRALLDGVIAELEGAGLAHARPPLGMMVEVPAAALEASAFDVAFYSIGSNDLVQYATAAARDNPAVAGLADPRNPAVLRLIREVVAAGAARDAEVSLCGDMASDPDLIPALLDTGLRTLSVAPAALARVKAAVAAWRGPSARP